MQGFIIGYLCSHNDCDVYQRDIEAEFKIRRSTATGILQLMEKNGLIERKLVSCDARLKKLVVTQKAVDMHNIFLVGIDDIESSARRGLSEDEIKKFLITLNKIRKNIE
ncbi:MAG: MarR family winged helix-turn-helix transcriptional regulator [Oscillospiraceae bacterium]|nr:MarR family winged helix-turn-helix transcriptional regulator [Oscillospiraceae bacterium]